MFWETLMLLLCLSRDVVAPVEVKQIGGTLITTQFGQLRGLAVDLKKSYLAKVEAFRGIKYGTVLNSSLRFLEANTDFSAWTGTQIANTYQAICCHKMLNDQGLQHYLKLVPKVYLRRLFQKLTNYTNFQTEECLTLNVHMPSIEWTDSVPLPVMVFVHGESYEIGTGNAYDGSVLASYGDVIVITVNYRLGVLGFLNINNSDANGNQALLDLMAVLHWVKDNIREFHGDPNKVTLFGHGHGAALVNILLLSPLVANGNMVHRAILQSGSALSSWATSYDPMSCAYRLALAVNCSKNDTAAKLACLKTKSAETLVNNSPKAPKYYSCMAPAPNNQPIFSKPVTELLQEPHSAFRSIPVMFGVTRNEAYAYLKQKELEKGISKDRKNKILRTFVANNYRFQRQKIFEILEHEYSSWDTTQTNSTRRDNILQLLSDGLYVAPLMKMAEKHAPYANTYVYAFGHSTKAEQYHNWSSAVHGDELPYVFGAPLVDGLGFFPKTYTLEEKKLSASMMRYWSNFAKTGNPNYPENDTRFELEKFKDAYWATYDNKQKKFMNFEGKPELKHHYRGKQMSLWFDLIPKLVRNDGTNSGKLNRELHDLHNVSDLTTFDDPHLLMSNFQQEFPIYPSIPPTPPHLIESGFEIYQPPRNNSVLRRLSPHNSEYQPKGAENGKTKREFSTVTSSPKTQIIQTKEKTSSVPLSITVAVGCSLLFLNIILFTAVYYQRRRIQRLNNRHDTNVNNEGACNQQASSKHRTDHLETRQSGEPHGACSQEVEDHNKTHIQSNPLYSVICKTPSVESSHRCSYESVSTDSPSPVRSNNKKNLHNNITPSIKKDTLTSSNTNSPKTGGGKMNSTTANHILGKQSNSTNDTVTVV